MQYLLLIYDNETQRDARTPETHQQVIADYMAYDAALRESGAHVAGQALESVRSATTVRVRDGKVTLTDGPFAETAEQLGGFYLVEADSVEDALKHAEGIPTAKFGCIEVRPLMVFE